MEEIKPTDSELEILQILWKNSPASVKDVNEKISLEKETGYTTTLKLMQIMHQKGLLNRMENGRSHLYVPAINQEKTQSQLLNRFMDAAFKGEAMKMVMQVLGNHEASQDELSEIKKLIEKLENK